MTAIRAQINEPSHPLDGAALHIRWTPGTETLTVEVQLHEAPRDRMWSRWVPIQLVQQYLDSTPDTGDAA